MAGIEDLRKAIKEEKAIFGTDRTMKLLREGTLKQIYLAANVDAQTKEDITRYASLSDVEVVQLDVRNNDLGTICKKPFAISVICVE